MLQKMRRVMTAGLVCLLCAGVFAGCGQKKEEPKEKKEEKKEELKTIGEEAEGENVYKVVLENKTGKDIVAVSVKDSSMEAFPENMLAEADKFLKDEKRNLFYEAKPEEDDQEEDDTPILDPQYDIQITFDDETVMVLHAFPFGDIEKGSVCLEAETAFVEYESVKTKEKISTKEAELAIKEEEKAKAEAEAKAQAEAEAAAKAAEEAQKKAEEEAAAAKAAQQQRQQQQSQPQQSQPQPSQPQPSQGGSDNGCLDEGLFY